VKYKLHTISIGQSTYWGLVKNLACGAFYSIGHACGAFRFIKNLACGAFFSDNFFLNRNAFDLKFLIMSTNSLVVIMIPTPILSDHNDRVFTKV